MAHGRAKPRGGRVFKSLDLERLEQRRLFAAAVGAGTGLIANYFSDTTLTNLTLARTDRSVNFAWGQGSPAAAIPNDGFTARWSGRVQAQYSETYTFYVSADDGVRLWVNGQQLINAWTPGLTTERSATIALKANELYDIKLEYWESTGTAGAALSWSSPSTAKQIIPTTQLYGSAGYQSGAWLDADVNAGGAAAGSFAGSPALYTVVGAGAGVAATSDELHIGYQSVNGDGSIVANVNAISGSAGARAAITFRDSLNPTARMVTLARDASGNVTLYARATLGAASSAVATLAAVNSSYVKLVRDGSWFKGYASPTGLDGSWTLVGTTNVTLGRTSYAGLGAWSGTATSTATATFSGVAVKAVVPFAGGVDSLVDWSIGNTFVDIAKQMRAPQKVDFSGVSPVDGTGSPTTDFCTIFQSFDTTQFSIYNGTYKLSFTGSATLSSWYAVTIGNQIYNAVSNTTTADVTLNANNASHQYFQLFFQNTKRTNASATNTGVTNIKLIRPGYAANTTQVFTDQYLAHVKQLSALRFMDFSQTNNNTTVNWVDRAKTTDFSQSSAKGVAWEYAIALANAAGKNLWINIPVGASDDYVTQLAALVKANLNPDLAVYLEYSNEVWNPQFTQYATDKNAAIAEVKAGGSNLNYDGETNVDYWGWRRTAKKIRAIGQTFAAAFGAGSMNTRVRPVLAGQFVNAYTVEQGLIYLKANYGDPSQYLYGIAGAPYFNLNGADSATNLTPDQVIAAMSASITSLQTQWVYLTDLAKQYGLRGMTYEAGPDTYGNNNIAAKKAASLDPRMAALVTTYMNNWYASGGDMMTWYYAGPTTYDTQFGTWGMTNDVTNLNTPKITATTAAVNGTRANLTAGFVVPGTIDARATYAATTPYSDTYLHYVHVGQYVDYWIRVPKSGLYSLTMSAGSPGTGGQIQLAVNGAAAQTVTLTNTNDSSVFVANAAGTLYLPEGMVDLRLTNVKDASSGGWGVQNLQFAPTFATIDNDGNLVVTGTNANDSVNLSATNGIVSATLNGSTISIALDGLSGVIVDGGTAGNDTLNVAGTLPLPVRFDGNVGNDKLNLTSGALSLNTDAGATSSSLAIDVAAGATLTFNASQNVGSLTVENGGTAVVSGWGGRLLQTGGLDLKSTGKLDLNDNDMMLTFATDNGQLQAVRAKLYAGYAFGDWNGVGIVSGTAAATQMSLGLMTGTDWRSLTDAPFDGIIPPANSILVKYSLAGDSNLDGVVDTFDLSLFASGSPNATPSRGWYSGDFDYSGFTDTYDLSILSAAFGRSG